MSIAICIAPYDAPTFTRNLFIPCLITVVLGARVAPIFYGQCLAKTWQRFAKRYRATVEPIDSSFVLILSKHEWRIKTLFSTPR